MHRLKVLFLFFISLGLLATEVHPHAKDTFEVWMGTDTAYISGNKIWGSTLVIEALYANLTDSLECPCARLDTIRLTGTHRMFVTTTLDAYMWNIVTPRGDTISFDFPKLGSNISRLYWVFNPPNDFIIKDQSGGGIFAIDTNDLHSDYYIDYGRINHKGKRAYIDTLLPEKIRMNNGAIITNPHTDSVEIDEAVVKVTGIITASTINTGNGNNELYPMNQDVKYTADPYWTNVGFRTTASALWEIGAVSANKFFIRSVTIDDTLMVWDRVNTKIDFRDKDIDNIDDATIEGELKGSRQNFGAGENTAQSSSAWMKTFNGVVMSGTKGYAMSRAGSIVSVSLLADCTSYGSSGDAGIEVYKNGAVVYSASATVSGMGIFKTYGKQARGTDTFNAGDVISLKYVIISGTFTLDDFICYVEVVFDD